MKTELILNFLAQLKNHNNKAWMDENRPTYLEAKAIFLHITEELILSISKFDAPIGNLEPKSCIFRINRDIRFSKDKEPYKTNLGTYLGKGGRHGGYAGYYLHIEPQNKSLIAGGLYCPENKILEKVRISIDETGDQLPKLTQEATDKETFELYEGESLKRPPRGYAADHPQIDWLKRKSFLLTHSLSDAEVKSPKFLPNIIKKFGALFTFNHFLNEAIEG